MARGRFLIMAVTLLAACGSQSTLRERIAGLRLDVPKEWSVHRLGVYCHGRIGPGLLITNLKDQTLQHPQAPGECTNAWGIDKLPENFILIDISRFNAHPLAKTRPQTQRFPIHESDLRQTTIRRLRAFNFWEGNHNFDLRIWTGKNIASSDRTKLRKLVESIRQSE
jgi:hypothetical protein